MSTTQPTRPRIIGEEYEVEPVVMSCEYDLPWNRQSSQTACGTMVQNQVGAKNWRVVIEGILSRPQLVKLSRMRDEEIVTVVTEEFQEIRVAFDNLNVRRLDEEEDAHFSQTEDGEHQGLLLHFQLQTKEDPDDEGEGIQFFNENTRGAVYGGE